MKHQYSVKVHIEDTDFGGVVYHANYLKFLERARTMWLEEIGFSIARQREFEVMFAVRHIEIDYLKPAALHKTLVVHSELLEIRRVSLVFNQSIIDQESDIALIAATVKVACIGKDFKPKALPQQLKEVVL